MAQQQARTSVCVPSLVTSFQKTLFGQLAEGIHHSFDFVLRYIGRHDEAESSIGPIEQLHSIAIDPGALLPTNSRCICAPARRYNRQLSRLLEYAELLPMVSENQPDPFSQWRPIPNHSSQNHAFR